MTLLNLGTYPPKQCGIATFSMDLFHSLLQHGNQVQIMAISENKSQYRYPREVIFTLRQHQKSDYARAAKFINNSPDVKLLIIQHEYGIYGGDDGKYILELIKMLHKPYILVTHTVLPCPSKAQKEILNGLCHRAAGIVCMTKSSGNLLADLYEAPPEMITVIAHGVPEFKPQSQEYLKSKYGLEGQTVVSTFGLIGPGKGLELGIKAIAAIVPRYPEVKYLILGQTHPVLRQTEGERYRSMLEALVAELSLQDHVHFVNKYLSDEEIGEYLHMTDIYLSPYPNRDQAVSGTLAFALGCGRAIVSTSYAYASEVLADGRGLLSTQASSEELAVLMAKVLDNGELKSSLQRKALELGSQWSWFSVGGRYTSLIQRILDDHFLLEDEKISYARL